MGLLEEENTFGLPKQDGKPFGPGREECGKDEEAGEKDEEEMEDDAPPSSFESLIQDKDLTRKDQKRNGPGNSPFSTCSLPLASICLLSSVPCGLQQSLLTWKDRFWQKPASSLSINGRIGFQRSVADSVSFPTILSHNGRL